MSDPLAPYRDKRDFARTDEPEGTVESDTGATLRFVVQKHAARALHYDLRLEVDGVMASWAVPKGPSYDPSVRRLAVHVEDHPLDYRTFEGTIAGGEYGGGGVIVWDQGTYRNDSEVDGRPLDLRAAIDKGHVRVGFDGVKLHGGWHLVRTANATRRATGASKDQWLLIKRRDETADPSLDIVAGAPRSVLSGRMVEEVSAGADATAAGWVRPAEPELVDRPGAEALVASGGWVLAGWPDGRRIVVVNDDGHVALWSGDGAPLTDRYPELAAAVATLPVATVALDAVIGDAPGGAFLRPVDLLHLLGRSTTTMSTAERLALLDRLTDSSDLPVPTPPTSIDEAAGQGWEAVLLRRLAAPYPSGPTPEWRVLALPQS